MGTSTHPHSPKLAALAALTIVAGLAATPAGAAAAPASPGAPGLDDRLFPELGNGGYDTRHYDLSMTYETAAPDTSVDGEVEIRARAEQALSSFNLDFAGDSVDGVWVDGRRAAWNLAGEELVVTPRRALRRNRRFRVTVEFTGHPVIPEPGDEVPFGWFTTVDGSVTAGQPDRSHEIYPSNDHPSDKATYSFRLDVPEGITAAANGSYSGSRTRAGRTTWRYELRQPMATQLVQLAVGDLEIIERGRRRGVNLRDVAPTAREPWLDEALATTPRHLDWMSDQVGRYPFDDYGVLAVDQFFLYALETQTLSLHPVLLFDPENFDPVTWETIMVHEIAHQWFGDSVAIRFWSDLWLSEGHATWYEWNYGDQFYDIDLTERIRAAYAQGDNLRAQYGPVALPSSNELFDLFSPNVYDGGAVVLYALRQVIGEEVFQRLERRWAQEFRGESVDTEDFIAFASRIARRDLRGFLRSWLYGTTTPPMPDHPDWAVDPVGTPAQQAQSSSQALETERGALAGKFRP